MSTNYTRLLQFSQQFGKFYACQFTPLLERTGLTMREVHVLLFLANNPAYQTAADIVEVRKIKANLVSVNVDKLVRDGYLTRESMPGDRRKTRLLCTEKAQPVIMQGRQLQSAFLQRLFAHTDQQMQDAFLKTIAIMDKNLNELLEGDIAE